MSLDDQPIQAWIHGYLDDSLSPEQQARLSQWIQSDPRHAQQFAAAVMLHDRLRNEWSAPQAWAESEQVLGSEHALASEQGRAPVRLSAAVPSSRWGSAPFAWATAACLLMLAVFVLWHSAEGSSASAAVLELNRIIEASVQPMDRTFLLSVEETAVPRNDRSRTSREHGRPPKPSLDGALLDVRGSDQFVLKRDVGQGAFFITGSNGKTSWAVRPDGPVRFSEDLSRFNRDLPGHETGVPINNLHDGLDALRTAYELEVMPVESGEQAADSNTEPGRLMVAVKKRGFLGPRRVEISYGASSGQIRQIRFVEMPYGPQQITLRMTLVEEQALAVDYFDHSSHHDPQRVVEIE